MQIRRCSVSLQVCAFTIVGLVGFTGGIAAGLYLQKLKRETNNNDDVSPQEEETTGEVAVVKNIPQDANEDCPGTESENAGKVSACDGCPNQKFCASGEKPPLAGVDQVRERLSAVQKKILILSGKGGVGKSTVASQIAWSLHSKQCQVGLLDVDICGPSIPRMTGCSNAEVHASGSGWSPVYIDQNFSVMSVGFLLPNPDDAVIWRGPKKNGMIRQFLSDVMWGTLDYLIVDTPPGTSDEHLSVVTYLKEAGVDGAVIVTTPQEISLQDVRKEINFCKKVGIPILGIVENMKGSVFDVFEVPENGFPSMSPTESMCERMEVPYLGAIQMDRELCKVCELGVGLPQNAAASADVERIVKDLQDKLQNNHTSTNTHNNNNGGNGPTIPSDGGALDDKTTTAATMKVPCHEGGEAGQSAVWSSTEKLTIHTF